MCINTHTFIYIHTHIHHTVDHIHYHATQHIKFQLFIFMSPSLELYKERENWHIINVQQKFMDLKKVRKVERQESREKIG